MLEPSTRDIGNINVMCGKEFNKGSNLSIHIRTVHELAKPYKCTVCGKRFGQAENLKTHMKSVHEGTKYPCTQCEHIATTAGNLGLHVKNAHLGEYSFNILCLGKVLWHDRIQLH